MTELPKERHTYFDYLRNIENWLNLLTATMRNPNTTSIKFDDGDVEETCTYMVDNLNDELPGMTPERRATVIITTLNILIRIYAADKFNLITSHAQYRHIVKTCTKQIEFYFKKSSDYSKYAAGMLDLLLMNFSQGDFIVKCLEEFFLKKSVSTTVSVTTDEQRRPDVIKDARIFMLKMIKFAEHLAYKAYVQSAEEFNNNYQSLMHSILKFVDNCFAVYDEQDAPRSQVIIIDHILSIAWNLTDKTPLVPMFVAAGYAETTVKWLRKPLFPCIIKDLGEQILSIAYNLSRHKKGFKALQEVKAFKILMECKSLIIEMMNDDLTEIFSMLLIALSGSDEEQKQNEDLILKISENLFSRTEEAFHHEDWRSDGGCHLSECLYTLQGAFSNTSIVRYVLGDREHVKKERIDFFARLLSSVYGLLFNQDVDDLEKLVVKSLLNIILCISNYKQYRDELYSHVFLCILIESLANQPYQDVAKRIWCNLQQLEDSKSLPVRSKKEKTPRIYISYNWTDENFCKLFIDALRKRTNLPIWVDYEHTNELQDPWEFVAPAIDSATIIIVLASSAYGQSRSNCQELTYVMAKMQPSDEEKSVIIVETVSDFKFNRDWMNNLLKKHDKISYHNDIDELINNVANHSALFKHRKHLLVPFLSADAMQSQVCTII